MNRSSFTKLKKVRENVIIITPEDSTVESDQDKCNLLSIYPNIPQFNFRQFPEHKVCKKTNRDFFNSTVIEILINHDIKLKNIWSKIISKVQDDLKNVESFNFNCLLDNRFKNGNDSGFNIIYDVYDAEPIDIWKNRTFHMERLLIDLCQLKKFMLILCLLISINKFKHE